MNGFAAKTSLYVCEMVTARAVVERRPDTSHMTTFAPDEHPRSLQLYTPLRPPPTPCG